MLKWVATAVCDLRDAPGEGNEDVGAISEA